MNDNKLKGRKERTEGKSGAAGNRLYHKSFLPCLLPSYVTGDWQTLGIKNSSPGTMHMLYSGSFMNQQPQECHGGPLGVRRHREHMLGKLL